MGRQSRRWLHKQARLAMLFSAGCVWGGNAMRPPAAAAACLHHGMQLVRGTPVGRWVGGRCMWVAYQAPASPIHLLLKQPCRMQPLPRQPPSTSKALT